jgi:hypothetical protein
MYIWGKWLMDIVLVSLALIMLAPFLRIASFDIGCQVFKVMHRTRREPCG